MLNNCKSGDPFLIDEITGKEVTARAGSRAVVLGGSIAGLFAARVLSEVYDEALVVDRDELLGVDGHRKGRPQGRHINAMLCKGRLVMEDLFPGITAELIADSCPTGDMCDNVRWYFHGRRAKQRDVGLLALPATAPLMERHIRERTAALPNVAFAERREILDLVTTADSRRVTGVRVQTVGSDTVEIFGADLVVEGRRTFKVRMAQAYLNLVQAAATRDGKVSDGSRMDRRWSQRRDQQ